MGQPSLPSKIWPTTVNPPAIDPPLAQDSNFRPDQPSYRAYLDSQARGAQAHLLQSLLLGQVGTWVYVDPTSPTLVSGQCVCMASSSSRSVTLAVAAALTLAGSVLGIVDVGASPGTWAHVTMVGFLAPSVTGLPTSGNALYACVNTSTGGIQTKSSLASTDYPVGTVDAVGNLTLRLQLAVAGGGGPPSAPHTVTGGTSYTMNSGDLWIKAQGNSTITLPSAPSPGVAYEYVITWIAGGTDASGITLQGNSYQISAPTNPYSFATSQLWMGGAGSSTRYRWDGIQMIST